MSEALKPCPFCGGERLKQDMVGRVLCEGCQATAPFKFLGTETWNTRADLPATDEQAFANEKVKALVEAVREIDFEYDPSEDGANAKTMFEIARAALAAMEEKP